MSACMALISLAEGFLRLVFANSTIYKHNQRFSQQHGIRWSQQGTSAVIMTSEMRLG